MPLPIAELITVTATNLEELNAKFKSKLDETWSTRQNNPTAIEKYFLLNLEGGVQTAVKVELIPGAAPEVWAKSLRHLSAVVPPITNTANEFIKSVSSAGLNSNEYYHDLHFDGDHLIKLAASQGGILPPPSDTPLEDALEKLQSKSHATSTRVVERKPEAVQAGVTQKSKSMFGWMNKFTSPKTSEKTEEKPGLTNQGPKVSGPRG